MTHTLTLHISGEMAEVISLVAKSEDATVGEVIRDAIRRDLKSRLHEKVDHPVEWHSQRPVAKLLKTDIETAQSWCDLQARLHSKGYRVMPSQNSLNLHRVTGERICRLSDIGPSEDALSKRFAAPFVPEAKRTALAGETKPKSRRGPSGSERCRCCHRPTALRTTWRVG